MCEGWGSSQQAWSHSLRYGSVLHQLTGKRLTFDVLFCCKFLSNTVLTAAVPLYALRYPRLAT